MSTLEFCQTKNLVPGYRDLTRLKSTPAQDGGKAVRSYTQTVAFAQLRFPFQEKTYLDVLGPVVN